jgi:hypothetical protein
MRMKNFFQSCWNTTVDYFKFIGLSFKAAWEKSPFSLVGLLTLDVLITAANFYLYGFAVGMVSLGIGVAVFFGVMGWFYSEWKQEQALAYALLYVPRVTVVSYSSDEPILS